MKNSRMRSRCSRAGAALLATALYLAALPRASGQDEEAGLTRPGGDLAQQIFEVMAQVHGARAGHRPVHAKGLVCEGTFVPTKEAARLSKAAHFQQAETPLLVRFSLGSPNPSAPDNSPENGPRGMAIRFKLPGDASTDIVAMSHHGFVVSNGEEMLALQKSVVATDPSKPHPWPVEEFLGSHPRALKFVTDNRVVPASFGTEAFFSNDSFIFVSADGGRQAVRYQILPVAGRKYLEEAQARAKPENFLVDDLKTRLAAGVLKYRLVAQLPNPGDVTKDPSLVWPDDRKMVELGTIAIKWVRADSEMIEARVMFDPASLTDGIEFSDDPLPLLRSRVYDISKKYRQRPGKLSITHISFGQKGGFPR